MKNSPSTPSTPEQHAALDALKVVLDADFGETDLEKTIDPGDEQDWYSLTLGFFLAKGLDVEAARRLSSHVRYELGYWRP